MGLDRLYKVIGSNLIITNIPPKKRENERRENICRAKEAKLNSKWYILYKINIDDLGILLKTSF